MSQPEEYRCTDCGKPMAAPGTCTDCLIKNQDYAPEDDDEGDG